MPERLTSFFLQKTTRTLIELHKTGSHSQLVALHNRLFKDNAEIAPKKAFLKLIKLYHPDTLESHKKALEEEKEAEKISPFYENFLSLSLNEAPRPDLSEAFSPKESYEADFTDYDDHMEGEDPHEIVEDEYDVISIISHMFLGNRRTEEMLQPVDLEQLDGELILGHRDIRDLEGIQYCRNIIKLDLSHNEIDNIYDLRGLHLLEELNLSFNEIEHIDDLRDMHNLRILYLDSNSIEDPSILLDLPRLEFVSLMDNPVKGMDVIRELTERGVVVVYY